jgi:hypothetical protein
MEPIKPGQIVYRPTIKQIEEYMAALNLPEAGFNGTTSKDLYDVISKPKHYMLFEEEGIEVRHVIERLVLKCLSSYEADKRLVPSWDLAPMFISDYVQLMQYLMRFMDKNGVEDLKKARWYLDKMIEES